MSETSEATATRLLPCTKDCEEWRGDLTWNQENPHHPSCLAYRRHDLVAELDLLKAERDAACAKVYKLNAEQLNADHGAEFVRGLEKGRKVATKFWYDCDDFDRAIQAEIDKAKAGK